MTVQVKMNDFSREPQDLKSCMSMAVQQVLDSGWLVSGPEVAAFERDWSQYLAAPHVVGVASGMAALELGLRGSGVGPGDEVVVTPLTAMASVMSIMNVGAIPVLADIDLTTGLMSLESAERCLSRRTRAIMLVHLFGLVSNMESWLALAEDADAILVEDCAQAHGALYKGVAPGNFGEFGAYSFYPTKNLGAAGEAGSVVTRSPEIKDAVASLRDYGQTAKYVHSRLGSNERLDEVQAALLRVRLRWLDRFVERRREIARAYRARIRNSKVVLLEPPEDEAQHAYHLFVVRTDHRSALNRHLEGRGIQSAIHYPVPAHQQEFGRKLLRDPRGLLASEEFAKSCLSIPCHPQITDSDAIHVIDALNDF